MHHHLSLEGQVHRHLPRARFLKTQSMFINHQTVESKSIFCLTITITSASCHHSANIAFTISFKVYFYGTNTSHLTCCQFNTSQRKIIKWNAKCIEWPFLTKSKINAESFFHQLHRFPYGNYVVTQEHGALASRVECLYKTKLYLPL